MMKYEIPGNVVQAGQWTYYWLFSSYPQPEEKILSHIYAELSNMAASVSRYSALNCSDFNQQS